MFKKFSYCLLIVSILAIAGIAQARGVLGEERNPNTVEAIEGSGLYGVLSSDNPFKDDIAPQEDIFEGEHTPEGANSPYEDSLGGDDDTWDFGDDIIVDDENFTEPSEDLMEENLDPQNELGEDSLVYLNDNQSDTEANLMSETNNTNTYEVAVIKTSKGQMILEFWPSVAPKTVQNFKTLANKGFYDGTAFHRVVKDFMIQGGDPQSVREDKKPLWGTGGPGYTIDAEFNDKKHVKGVVSMARAADPDSAGSQFFICLADAPFLDGQYTAFGKLTSGEDVLEAIGNTPTEYSQSGEKSQPLERIEVESIKIMNAEELAKSVE